MLFLQRAHASSSARDWQLTNCSFALPSPRAATAVATSTVMRPVLKSQRANSRSRCIRSPWILVVGISLSDRYDAKKSAVRFVSTNTNVFSRPVKISYNGNKIYIPSSLKQQSVKLCDQPPWEMRSVSFERFSNFVTKWKRCSTSEQAPPTMPTARKR